MKISRQIVRGCRIAILLGILLLMANAIWHPLEPRYNGQRLSVWVKILSIHSCDYSFEEDRELLSRQGEAAEPIRHLGTDALPLALKYCGAHDYPLMEKFKDWANEQKLFAVHIPSDYDYQRMGIAIFEALGPAGKPAAFSLIKLFRKDDPNVANAASMSLVHIGPDSIPPLTAALTNVNDPVREMAALTLAGFETQARDASPLLLNLLKDKNARLRGSAAWALGCVGPDLEAAVPALLSCLKDPESHVRGNAAMSLGHIRAHPEQVMPALLDCIAAETNLPSSAMISAIARFGTNARPWSPILVQMIESNRFGFWTGSALNALKKIDPKAAEPLIQRREFIRTNSAPKFSYRNPPVQHLQPATENFQTNPAALGNSTNLISPLPPALPTGN